MPDGVYNGSQCPPDKRQAIKEQILAGVPVNAIAANVGASNSTVAVIRDQELPEWRKTQANNFKQYASNVTRSLLAMTPEQLAKASLYERTVSLGIVIDKINALEGEPTAIVEHRHTVDLSSLSSSLGDTTEIVVQPINDNLIATSPVTPELPKDLAGPQ